jgi:hypothetical protein
LGILDPPSYGIGSTIRIGREMLCLPYAGFLVWKWFLIAKQTKNSFLADFALQNMAETTLPD